MVRTVIAQIAFLSITNLAAAQRLSGDVVPDHYALWLAPDLENATFRGRETIDVRLLKPANGITLHAAEITFDEVTITAGGSMQRARIAQDAKAEMATLTVPDRIPAGPATIQIAYTGLLNDKLRGFYLSKANGRRYAVTQMEATDARRAFPSFDEPRYKATFDISIMIDGADTAISNGPQISDTPGPQPGKHTVVFGRTLKMSAYLVAMLVGDFVCRDGMADDIPIRVCSTPDKKALTGFALEAATRVLTFYNTYFGIKYPFGKLDIVGIPDFAAGAMENTGAITFRERYLLADPERASLGSQKLVASTIAHEIAHQWFGDLVTMKWWDDIWLNEGFATWLANKPLAQWRPDWHVELDDVEETQGAASVDALRSTRAIRTNVETPEEINEVFDAIAYNKAAAVLRMVEHFVGAETFRKGVSSYLRKYSFSNAAAEDFWTEVASVSGKPVDRIMKSYVDQPGIPVLKVADRCLAGKAEVELQQERFIGVPGAGTPRRQTWTIPVCARPLTGAARCEIVDQRTEQIPVESCGVFANADSHGYFFSEYNPDVVETLAHGTGATLTPSERLGILGDEWWMVRAGRHDIGVFLDLAGAFANDEVPPVTEQIATRLAYADEYIVPTAQRAKYHEWIRERFTPALDALGLSGDAHDSEDRQSRRAALLTLVGVTGDSPDVQMRARNMAMTYIADRNALPGTLVSPVLHVAALSGDGALFDGYLAQMKAVASDPEEYYRFFNALSWFRDPALTQRALEFAVSPDVRTQDTGTLLAGLLARPWAREAAWTFLRQQWPTLTRTLGTFQGIPAIVGALNHFCSKDKGAEIRQFFKEHPATSSERTLQQSLERIEVCAAVNTRQAPVMSAWLTASPQDHKDGSATKDTKITK